MIYVYIFIGYLIGSISGSMIIGKFKKVDIRKQGSGNAGATNAFRTQGFKFALYVATIDVLKGFLPIFFMSKFVSEITTLKLVLCSGAIIVGHVYPLYHNFRGGKGAATLIGILLALYPNSVIYLLATWICVLVLTGYVGLSTMCAGISLVFYTYLVYPSGLNSAFGYFTITIALFLIHTHRSNIQRMINGTESCFEKICIFKRKQNL